MQPIQLLFRSVYGLRYLNSISSSYHNEPHLIGRTFWTTIQTIWALMDEWKQKQIRYWDKKGLKRIEFSLQFYPTEFIITFKFSDIFVCIATNNRFSRVFTLTAIWFNSSRYALIHVSIRSISHNTFYSDGLFCTTNTVFIPAICPPNAKKQPKLSNEYMHKID